MIVYRNNTIGRKSDATVQGWVHACITALFLTDNELASCHLVTSLGVHGIITPWGSLLRAPTVEQNPPPPTLSSQSKELKGSGPQPGVLQGNQAPGKEAPKSSLEMTLFTGKPENISTVSTAL